VSAGFQDASFLIMILLLLRKSWDVRVCDSISVLLV
jgi:hypothetical protein